MKKLIGVAVITASTLGANAQTIRPHDGPICPGAGPVYVKPTPACGATTLHGGFFKPGKFRRMYQSTATGCIPKEIFIGCR